MNSSTEMLSIGVSASGRQTIDVTPPAAAAALADSKLSLCSPPGSGRWTLMSIRPGARQYSWQSTMRASSGAPPLSRPGPQFRILLPSISTPPGASVPLAGSISRALI
jgi:hypothetical protein